MRTVLLGVAARTPNGPLGRSLILPGGRAGPSSRQTARVDATEAARVLEQHGLLLESARGPVPNVAEMVAGEPIRGSWWGHRDSHAIFAVINALADSPDVVRLRIVNGKITLVHRRLWPALVRLAEHFPLERLAAVREEHTET